MGSFPEPTKLCSFHTFNRERRGSQKGQSVFTDGSYFLCYRIMRTYLSSLIKTQETIKISLRLVRGIISRKNPAV